ncbi:hypothetical protein [Roseicyclus sp.]|uniref:hypothetical protein n=1 Tax=Roseicyclus sp. TaxID=1914329 RepID=UPI003F9F9986
MIVMKCAFPEIRESPANAAPDTKAYRPREAEKSRLSGMLAKTSGVCANIGAVLGGGRCRAAAKAGVGRVVSGAGVGMLGAPDQADGVRT